MRAPESPSTPRIAPWPRSSASPRPPSRPACSRRSAASADSSPSSRTTHPAPCWWPRRTVWEPSSRSPRWQGCTTRWGRTWSTTASTTSWCKVRGRCSSSTTWPPADWSRGWPPGSWRGLPERAAPTAARCSAARPRRCRGSTRPASTTSPASSSAPADATTCCAATTCGPAMRSWPALHRPAHQRLLPGSEGVLRGARP